MAEPTSTATAGAASLVVLSVAALGPILGPYLVMTVFAFGGALVSLAGSPVRGFLPSLGFVLRGVFIGLTFTGLLADYAASHGWASSHAVMAPAAAVLGALADKWKAVRNLVGSRFGADVQEKAP